MHEIFGHKVETLHDQLPAGDTHENSGCNFEWYWPIVGHNGGTVG